MYAKKLCFGNKEISVFAPSLPYAGHTVTNLAKFQVSFLNLKYSSSHEKNQINKYRNYSKINYYHLGNHPAYLDVLSKFSESRSARNVLILHDTNLIDLLLFAVNKSGLKSLEFLLKKQSPHLIKSLLRNNKNLDQITKCSFFLNSIINADLPDTKIVIHNSKNLKFSENIRDGILNHKELPIGYHFMNSFKIKQSPYIPLIVLGGAGYDTSGIKFIIQQLKTKFHFRVIFLSGTAQFNPGTLSQISGVSIVKNVSNINWQLILSRAIISIKLGTGRNGESSGFLRDSILLSKFNLGDEESSELSSFSNYQCLPQDYDMFVIKQKIHEILNDSYSNSTYQSLDRNIEKQRLSLYSYFNFLNKFVDAYEI